MTLTLDKTATKNITWNQDKKVYQYPSGKVVNDKTLANLLLLHQYDAETKVTAIGKRLIDKEISLLQWQLDTRQALKELHLANLLLARGGKKNATAKDYAQLGVKLKSEYKYLREFTKDLKAGRVSEDQFYDRLSKYILSSETSYSRGVKQNYIDMGYLFAERQLNSQVPCKDCPAIAMLGIVSIEDLILPKEQCACGSRCRCSIIYYKTIDG